MIRLKCIDREAVINHYHDIPVASANLIINSIENQIYEKVDGVYFPKSKIKFDMEISQFFIEMIDDVKIDMASSFNASMAVPARSMGFVMGKFDPEVLGCLLGGQGSEEIGILGLDPFRPLAVVCKQVVQQFHFCSP